MDREQAWLEARRYSEQQLALARSVLEDLRAGTELGRALRRHTLPGGGYLPKHLLVHAYRQIVRRGEWPPDPALLRRIRLKPVRTLSGVTTVTVLTKPYACPGECIFCPSDVRMPKSYLPDEPGGARALQHEFDPYAQVCARLDALQAIGHPTDKVELLILGGTWSFYARNYQQWFVKRCLDALNGFEAASLDNAQAASEEAPHRNVGLVIETRPDQVTVEEMTQLRRLGVTKVQLGIQSLDDGLLALNRRGHTVQDSRRAARLLRAAGFKVVMHWMPNLLGATLQTDREDFGRLWIDQDLRPDEIKIYPCQLLEGTELHSRWVRGDYVPYSTEELVGLIADLKTMIPRYCRVNRVVRDIPSRHVVAGNKRSSLRQDVQRELRRRGMRCDCIRCREVREQHIVPGALDLQDLTYVAGGAEEHFLSFVTSDDRLAGYLRLSLPGAHSPSSGQPDLHGAAIVRDLHVFGQALPVGLSREGAAQHQGLGAQLMERAEAIALRGGFGHLAVIAALGTRGYYRSLGFQLTDTYMVKPLS